MSYTTIQQCTVDTAFNNRVIAAIAKEAFEGGPEFKDSDFGEATRLNSPYSSVPYLIWPVCIEYEAEYAYAIGEGNPNPGGDDSVITDANIQASVQTNWPQDPWPPSSAS